MGTKEDESETTDLEKGYNESETTNLVEEFDLDEPNHMEDGRMRR